MRIIFTYFRCVLQPMYLFRSLPVPETSSRAAADQSRTDGGSTAVEIIKNGSWVAQPSLQILLAHSWMRQTSTDEDPA